MNIIEEAQRFLDGWLRARWIGPELPRELPRTRSGTCRSWFVENNGREVWTGQVTWMPGAKYSNPWMPGPRTIDASMASYVKMDGGRRDYAGMRVDGVSEELLVASAPFGDGRQIMLYRLDNRTTPVLG